MDTMLLEAFKVMAFQEVGIAIDDFVINLTKTPQIYGTPIGELLGVGVAVVAAPVLIFAAVRFWRTNAETIKSAPIGDMPPVVDTARMYVKFGILFSIAGTCVYISQWVLDLSYTLVYELVQALYGGQGTSAETWSIIVERVLEKPTIEMLLALWGVTVILGLGIVVVLFWRFIRFLWANIEFFMLAARTVDDPNYSLWIPILSYLKWLTLLILTVLIILIGPRFIVVFTGLNGFFMVLALGVVLYAGIKIPTLCGDFIDVEIARIEGNEDISVDFLKRERILTSRIISVGKKAVQIASPQAGVTIATAEEVLREVKSGNVEEAYNSFSRNFSKHDVATENSNRDISNADEGVSISVNTDTVETSEASISNSEPIQVNIKKSTSPLPESYISKMLELDSSLPKNQALIGLVTAKYEGGNVGSYENLLEEFIKMYYSNNTIPSEIIINQKFHAPVEIMFNPEIFLDNWNLGIVFFFPKIGISNYKFFHSRDFSEFYLFVKPFKSAVNRTSKVRFNRLFNLRNYSVNISEFVFQLALFKRA